MWIDQDNCDLTGHSYTLDLMYTYSGRRSRSSLLYGVVSIRNSRRSARGIVVSGQVL